MQSEKVGGQWVWWVDALYRAVPDLNRYFDGVAIHAYGNSNVTQLNPIIPGVPYNNYDNVRRAENIRQLFINHGGGGKPFWITEVGWSTCSDGNIDCVSWAQQAVNLTALFGLLRTSWKSWVQAVLIYRYTDGSNPSAFYDGYGLTTPSGAAKPALAVFRAAALTSSLGP